MTVQSDESLYFQIDKAERSLQRTIDWVSRHDVRSNGLFGISIAMMGMLSTVVPPFSQWNVEIAISISLTVVSFIVTITSLLLGVLPRTTTQTQSVLFFGSAARMDCDDLLAKFTAATPASYLDDLVAQYHVNAVIVDLKFRLLKVSMLGLSSMLLPWMLSIYFCKVIGNIP